MMQTLSDIINEATAANLNRLKERYYKLSDGAYGIPDIKNQLKRLTPDEAKNLGINVADEIKIFDSIDMAMNKSKLGVKL